MSQGPREKKTDKEHDKDTDREKHASPSEQKKITNVPEDRPGETETSQEKPDSPKPL